jgi:uncharacterized protein YbaR (Trm112 family)
VIPLDRKLLELIACPVCREKVSAQNGFLVCGKCGRKYPVRDGVPVMILPESRK